MEDIQNQTDHRELPIDKVGVCDLRYPITVWDKTQSKQATTATISMSVNLPKEFKGTHMSRFIEVLNKNRGEVSLSTLPTILSQLRTRLDANAAQMEVRFPYFLEKEAPVTKEKALVDYQCTFVGEMNETELDFVLEVEVPVKSLCPCSKAISDYGAHNQRGYVNIQVRTQEPEFVWIEELIEYAESSASAPLYALLKRPDERHVTMQAYDNPAFVEDIVRNTSLKLMNDPRITWFRVQTTNHESIHNHNAFAVIEWSREKNT